jgi:hypothetical protein
VRRPPGCWRERKAPPARHGIHFPGDLKPPHRPALWPSQRNLAKHGRARQRRGRTARALRCRGVADPLSPAPRSYRETELIHARWAMLGALGCVVPEVFGPPGTPNWVNIQAEIFRPEGLNYLDNPAIIHAQSPVITVAVLVIIMGLAEAFRANGELPGTIEGLDKLHPGGPFDPLGLADDPDAFALLKVKEIKNGMRIL